MPVGRDRTDDAFWSRALEGATKAATIIALALPAIGVATRWLSYELGSLPSWLATAAPITDLAFVGLSAMLPAVLVGLLVAPLATTRPRPGGWVDRAGEMLFGRVVMAPWPIARLVNYGPYVLFLLVLPLTILPSAVAGWLGGSRLGMWTASPDRERFREVAPSLLMALGLLALTAGLISRTNDPLYIEQAGQMPPRQGWYSPLGEDGTFRYAYSCAEGVTVAIPTASITRITIGEPPEGGRTSLSALGILLGHEGPRPGYAPGCPTAPPGAPAPSASPLAPEPTSGDTQESPTPGTPTGTTPGYP